jgi:hypothetical protein
LKGLPQCGQNFGTPLLKSTVSPQSLHFIWIFAAAVGAGFGSPQLLQNLPEFFSPHFGQVH